MNMNEVLLLEAEFWLEDPNRESSTEIDDILDDYMFIVNDIYTDWWGDLKWVAYATDDQLSWVALLIREAEYVENPGEPLIAD